jgi:hypothetical protein
MHTHMAYVKTYIFIYTYIYAYYYVREKLRSVNESHCLIFHSGKLISLSHSVFLNASDLSFQVFSD